MSAANRNEVEQSVHLLIENIIAEFVQKTQTPKNQVEFDKAVQQLIEEIFEKFRAKYERIKNAEKFKNIFLKEVRSRNS